MASVARLLVVVASAVMVQTVAAETLVLHPQAIAIPDGRAVESISLPSVFVDLSASGDGDVVTIAVDGLRGRDLSTPSIHRLSREAVGLLTPGARGGWKLQVNAEVLVDDGSGQASILYVALSGEVPLGGPVGEPFDLWVDAWVDAADGEGTTWVLRGSVNCTWELRP